MMTDTLDFLSDYKVEVKNDFCCMHTRKPAHPTENKSPLRMECSFPWNVCQGNSAKTANCYLLLKKFGIFLWTFPGTVKVLIWIQVLFRPIRSSRKRGWIFAHKWTFLMVKNYFFCLKFSDFYKSFLQFMTDIRVHDNHFGMW